jgi:methylmalonyl-CoA/ethylmalonyl-CoA epimerase
VTPGIVTSLDHVAIAVRDLVPAVDLFHHRLGGQFIAGGDDDTYGMRTMQFRFPPGVKIELMQPLRDDCHLNEFLERRGPGIHHVTVFVDDLGDAIKRLQDASYELVDTSFARRRWQETYLRPRSSFGTLVQVAQTDRDWTVPIDPDITIADVLAGRIAWVDDDPVRRPGTTPGD